MADDERRGQVEAVEAILDRIIDAASRAGADGVLPAEQVRVECLRATYALDRLRDARGDAEAARCGCNELLGGHRDECPKWGDPPAARSPQDEDHELQT